MVSKDIFGQQFKAKIIGVRKAFQEGKLFRLKELANEAIKEAVVRNDSTWADLAVLSYSFYKLLTKKHIKQSARWEESKRQIVKALNECIEGTQEFDASKCKIHYQKIVKRISAIDQKLGHYVQNTYGKSRIKMASSAYAFGASLSKAAELTGASIDDVQRYIGATTIHDEMKEKKSIESRLKRLKELLP
jgi:hypothetical protein